MQPGANHFTFDVSPFTFDVSRFRNVPLIIPIVPYNRNEKNEQEPRKRIMAVFIAEEKINTVTD